MPPVIAKVLLGAGLALLASPVSVWADCTSPAGSAGNVIFSTTAKTMQYCNGTNWVNAGPSIANAAQTGCTSPSGTAGKVVYDSARGVVQFCNGSNWVNTACAAERSPGGSGCGGKAAGSIRYSSTANELQFCDSTNWVAMGWGCSGGGGAPGDTTPPVWLNPNTFTSTIYVGDYYSMTPSVSEETELKAFPFSIQGPLPGWLSFNSTTGGVIGTASPAEQGNTYSYTIRATDAAGNYVERTFTITVEAIPIIP